jgi:hypothetical protein
MMNPAETFTLIVAPATILVLAVLVLLGFRMASRRFAVRERHLLDAIEVERYGGDAPGHTPRDKVRTGTKRNPAERRSESGG